MPEVDASLSLNTEWAARERSQPSRVGGSRHNAPAKIAALGYTAEAGELPGGPVPTWPCGRCARRKGSVSLAVKVRTGEGRCATRAPSHFPLGAVGVAVGSCSSTAGSLEPLGVGRSPRKRLVVASFVRCSGTYRRCRVLRSSRPRDHAGQEVPGADEPQQSPRAAVRDRRHRRAKRSEDGCARMARPSRVAGDLAFNTCLQAVRTHRESARCLSSAVRRDDQPQPISSESYSIPWSASRGSR